MRVWYCVIGLGADVLAGCSTGAQIEANRMRTTAAATYAASETCYDNVTAKADYVPLQSKMYLGKDNNFPLQFTTDQSRPTKQEIVLLYKFHGDVQACRKISLEGFAQVHPLMMLTLVESYSAKDKVWAEVVSGRLTWGQFNQAIKDVAVETQSKGTRVAGEIDGQLQNRHAYEVEQRQRAAAAFQQWSHQQQVLANQRAAIAAANRPQTINCHYVGNTAQCTSF